MFIEIARREHLNTQRLDGMHQLRAHIFKDKKIGMSTSLITKRSTNTTVSTLITC